MIILLYILNLIFTFKTIKLAMSIKYIIDKPASFIKLKKTLRYFIS